MCIRDRTKTLGERAVCKGLTQGKLGSEPSKRCCFRRAREKTKQKLSSHVCQQSWFNQDSTRTQQGLRCE
eukprot:8911801-Alexandrium_andersonii.AAC.1